MQVSMFRGRKHIACNVDPNNIADNDAIEDVPMEIKPMASSALASPVDFEAEMGLDPVMVWKADALRALSNAPNCTLTLGGLEAKVANPSPENSYMSLVQENLVERNLAKWVVENESIQLIAW
jgi:hypothetical protein